MRHRSRSVYARMTDEGLTMDSVIAGLEQDVGRLARELEEARAALRLLFRFATALDKLIIAYRAGLPFRIGPAADTADRLRPKVRDVREKFGLREGKRP